MNNGSILAIMGSFLIPLAKKAIGSRNKYYHITPTKNLSSIMSTGLVPRIPVDMQGEPQGVYLFKSKEDAETALGGWFADRDIWGFQGEEGFVPDDGFSLLEIDSNGIMDTNDVDAAQYEIIVTHKIEPRFISIVQQGSKSLDDFDDENKGGDCFEAAGRWMMNNFSAGDDTFLVHGEIRGRGPLQDIWFGHAWIEQGDEVIEVAGGKNIRMPKHIYYILGTIDQPYYQDRKMHPPKNNVLKYTRLQTMEKLAEFKTWGPWELETETGY